MANIRQVKTLLGISDNLQDDLLKVVAELTESHFYAYSGIDEVPEGLEYIITEVMVKRFNRIGAEGLKSQSIEGLKHDFNLNDFEEYDSIIKRVCSETFSAGFKML